MSNDKYFCIECETIQHNKTTCMKCSSANLFNIGKRTRFPKSPKKGDFYEVFGSMISMEHRLDKLEVLKKYIMSHKYRNGSYVELNPLAYDTTFTAMVLNKIKKIEQRKKEQPNRTRIRCLETYKSPLSMTEDFAMVIAEATTDRNGQKYKQGWIIPVYFALAGSVGYDGETLGNLFKPRLSKASDFPGNYPVFGNRKVASTIAHYLATEVLTATNISKDAPENERVIKDALEFSKKKYEINEMFGEYFV